VRLLDDSGQLTDANDQVERLVTALCERLTEVLPKGQFDVTVEHRHAIRIRAPGPADVIWLSPMFLWRSRSPVDHRLQLFLDQFSQRIQSFVSHSQKRRWPGPTAKPGVAIEKDTIMVWWGGAHHADAIVALRPISREEIGV
jgi:hypothetical protein